MLPSPYLSAELASTRVQDLYREAAHRRLAREARRILRAQLDCADGPSGARSAAAAVLGRLRAVAAGEGLAPAAIPCG